MTVFDLAKNYYPDFWSKARLRHLVEAGKLTAEEYRLITGEDYET